MPRKGVKMTDAAIFTAEVGNRIANWLRQAYPRDGAKLAARDFDASPHTTRRWFEGVRPENRHFDQMVRRWGKGFFDFVYGPVTGQGDQNGLSARVAELSARLESLETSWRRGPFRTGRLDMAAGGDLHRDRGAGDHRVGMAAETEGQVRKAAE